MNAVDELIREFARLADQGDAAEHSAADVARRRLRDAVADERRPRRRRWRLAIPVAVAGGLAAVILAIAALLPERDATAPAPASAAIVLERAARAATRTPAAYPGPHQYLYLRFREGWAEVENSIAFQTTDTQQTWVAPDGSGRQRLIVDGPPRFLTPRDREAWIAAGRPKLVPASRDGTYPAGGYPAGNQVDPTRLPTQPAQLLAAIVRRFEGGRFGVEQTFAAAGALLDYGSPALRAALYRVVANLPGVQLLGRRADALGRTGLAVGVMAAGGVRDELLFDPASSEVLEAAQVKAAPGVSPRIPVGTVLHYQVYMARGIVNSIEAVPGGGRVPFPRAAR